jgi:hypothetical protein
MTETHPPRFAEALLEAFGADLTFRDAILGDMAQEHAQRVERHGERAAHLWYYRQAAMTAPHLLRNWFAGAQLGDARRLLNVAGLAYVMTLMINAGIFFGTIAVASAIAPGSKPTTGPFGLLMLGGLTFWSPICAGYLIATFEEAKPMTAAVALAVLWGTLQIVAAIVVYFAGELTLDIPTWMRMAAVPLIMGLCVLGGAIRVGRAAVPNRG